MRKNQNKEHKFWHALSRVIPYLAAAVLIFAVAAFGSKDKTASGTSGLNMTDIAASDGATADQLSELYVVASLSSAMNLASTDAVSGNYVSASVLRDIAQTSADKIEKPGYTPVANPRGVVTYIVDADDTMESIAASYGISTDQIRWSIVSRLPIFRLVKSLACLPLQVLSMVSRLAIPISQLPRVIVLILPR